MRNYPAIYVCSCGCEIYKEERSRARDPDNNYRFCCPVHYRAGFVQHVRLHCIGCGNTYNEEIRPSPQYLRCPACRVEPETTRGDYRPAEKSTRLYDCHYYDDCLYDSPKEPEFNCTKCTHYREESPELRLKRNTYWLQHSDTTFDNMRTYHAPPTKKERNINVRNQRIINQGHN